MIMQQERQKHVQLTPNSDIQAVVVRRAAEAVYACWAALLVLVFTLSANPGYAQQARIIP